jgi:copper transport protein
MRKLLVVFLLVSTLGIPLVEGHPFTLETNPPQASNSPAGITQIQVHYSEAIEINFSTLKILDSNGEQVDNKDTSYFEGEDSLVVTTPPLQDGVYTVTSKVLSQIDGHLVDYAFVFAVGEVKIDPALLEQQGSSELIFFPEAAARFPGFVGETIVLGAVISSLLIWGTQRKDLIKEKLTELKQTYHNKFLTLTGAALIAVFTSNILLLMMQTIRLETSAFEAIQTSFGFTWIIRMAITIALLIVWFWLERKPNISKKNHFLILILSLALIGTSTMIGHGAASEQLAPIILDYVHNLIASIWIGGIIFFVFVLLSAFSRLDRDQRERLSLTAIPRFSIMIVISLGVLIITGPTLLWFLESDVGLLVESTYGMLILAKIGIASVMIVFGGYKQFRVQRRAEMNLKAGTISVHKKLKRSLKIESALGIALLGVVALLTNGTLPAGEIQSVQAEQLTYGFQTVDFSENAKFDVNIAPFSSGANTISVIVTDLDNNPLQDLGTVKVKVSNPARNISPIETPMNEIQVDEKTLLYEGGITFGFSGKWLVEIEAQRTQNANEGIFIETIVKPRLSELKTEIIEYPFPSTNSAPLYPVFDGKDSILISDTGKPRIWKFSIENQEFDSFEYEGKTSIVLTIDNDGKIWFTDTPESNIGFLDPNTEKLEIIPLPMDSIPIEIKADFDNNIWVALTDKNMLVKYDQKTGKFEEYVIPTDPAGPFAVLRDSEGNIWFTETQSGKIGVIDPKTGEIKEFSPAEPLKSPEAMFFDMDGNLWITEHTGLAIVKFDPVLETFEKYSIPDSDALPFGITADRYGNIWFAQHTVDSLGVYDPQNNNLIEVPIPTTTSFTQFVTSDNEQNIWFVEQKGNKLGMVKISETPNFGPLPDQIQKTELKYTELVSPLISLGIIATSLFFVKSVRDKRRIDALLE